MTESRDESAMRVAIVGAGHAGGRVAQHLRALGHRGPISLIGDEVHAPYERPALSKALLDGSLEAEALTLGPTEFWHADALDAAGIAHIRTRVGNLDADARRLSLADGRTIDFDRLVVATGGRPRRHGVPGASLDGVHVLRTIEDSLALRRVLGPGRRLVVIGGGVIGMEVAASAVSMGTEVSVIEAGTHIMARCLPPDVSLWLAGEHQARGVRQFMQARTNGIEPGRERALVVLGQDREGTGFRLDADAVLLSIGVDCTPDFLADSGIAGPDGIVVDARCRSTLHPWLYAAGDVACTPDPASGRNVRQETWRNAENQSRAVAEFLMGRIEPYRETPWMWTDQYGRNIQVIGVPQAGDVAVTRGAPADGPAAIMLLRGERLGACVLIDQGRERRHLEKLVAGGGTVDVGRLADPTVPLRELAR
ncbi:NAD(P)/FAD-dependent oxidoreductase [Chitinasiproducens palmae]|uniref:3-phenylpropionate/trans-cinnamate dioxygenase ferredoxin reductase subunit n=1 Tax=Chitinasiproducens palmae TaxID=1770053 RepID=A0A1H2PLG7_9BURK|nr:FAD-dependent oxidoreductase [Chitinasiproducens palmae]SDV47286.1 3-phenylpropionate/trans-cinnamate dioxygenase ferredoxin reductase subunit [Chitinasiproducens palmae]